MWLLEPDDRRTRQQCEQLEAAWTILNDAATELASTVVALPPDIYMSLRGAKDLISLCRSHPKLADLTPTTIDAKAGFCVACCGTDIVARIKCELRGVEDALILRAMNEVGSEYALKLQAKTMRAWPATKIREP